MLNKPRGVAQQSSAGAARAVHKPPRNGKCLCTIRQAGHRFGRSRMHDQSAVNLIACARLLWWKPSPSPNARPGKAFRGSPPPEVFVQLRQSAASGELANQVIADPAFVTESANEMAGVDHAMDDRVALVEHIRPRAAGQVRCADRLALRVCEALHHARSCAPNGAARRCKCSP